MDLVRSGKGPVNNLEYMYKKWRALSNLCYELLSEFALMYFHLQQIVGEHYPTIANLYLWGNKCSCMPSTPATVTNEKSDQATNLAWCWSVVTAVPLTSFKSRLSSFRRCAGATRWVQWYECSDVNEARRQTQRFQAASAMRNLRSLYRSLTNLF